MQVTFLLYLFIYFIIYQIHCWGIFTKKKEKKKTKKCSVRFQFSPALILTEELLSSSKRPSAGGATLHADNSTRNQSSHSYRLNRWANMLPSRCPYYSGAATGGPQETVEPDGIEVLSLLSEQVMNYCRTNGLPHGRGGNPRTRTRGSGCTTATPPPTPLCFHLLLH